MGTLRGSDAISAFSASLPAVFEVASCSATRINGNIDALAEL